MSFRQFLNPKYRIHRGIFTLWISVFLIGISPLPQVEAATKIVKSVETSDAPTFSWSNRKGLSKTSLKIKEYDSAAGTQSTVYSDSNVTALEWTARKNTIGDPLDTDKLYKVILNHKKSNGKIKEKVIYYATPTTEKYVQIDGNELLPADLAAASNYKYDHGTECFNTHSTASQTFFGKINLENVGEIVKVKVYFNGNSVTATETMTTTLEKDKPGTTFANRMLYSTTVTYAGATGYGSVEVTTPTSTGDESVEHEAQYYVRCVIPAGTSVQKICVYYRNEFVRT